MSEPTYTLNIRHRPDSQFRNNRFHGVLKPAPSGEDSLSVFGPDRETVLEKASEHIRTGRHGKMPDETLTFDASGDLVPEPASLRVAP